MNLDLTGLFCPEPVLRTKIAMIELPMGESLMVTVDDPDAEEDIPRWAHRVGYKSKVCKQDDKIIIEVWK